MLKVKLNLDEKEIQKPEFIQLNEIQMNYKHIIFPFYDNDFVQFIKLDKVDDYYELSYKEGFNEDEVIVEIEDLDKKYIGEAIQKFLEFNSDIITEYEVDSLKETILFLLDNENYSVSSDFKGGKIKLTVETNTCLDLVYNITVNPYGVICGEGYIYNNETFKTICSGIKFVLDNGVGEDMSIEDLFSIVENIEDDYYLENIIKYL